MNTTKEYNTPKNQAFKKAYFELAKKNNDPVNIMFAALHYDAASMLLEGMKQNGPTAEGIKKYLDNVKDFDGVTGKLSFNKEHDVVRPAPRGFTCWKSRAASTSRCSKDGVLFLVCGCWYDEACSRPSGPSPGSSWPTTRIRIRPGVGVGDTHPTSFF